MVWGGMALPGVRSGSWMAWEEANGTAVRRRPTPCGASFICRARITCLKLRGFFLAGAGHDPQRINPNTNPGECGWWSYGWWLMVGLNKSLTSTNHLLFRGVTQATQRITQITGHDFGDPTILLIYLPILFGSLSELPAHPYHPRFYF